jgi:phage tail-like protein
MAERNTRDTYTTFHFAVEIGGAWAGSFDEVTGLDVKTEVVEIKEGGVNGHVHKMPGRISHSNVTLKWGSQHNSDLWDWYKNFTTKANKESELKDVSIVQFDQTHQQVRRWDLLRAFPVKWVGPSYKAGDSQLAIETLELAFSDLAMRNV